ncbi:hypothetical protein TURU_016430 [Turdus rufiventris]|nr:hypothetical protein TURU_016430 [Turdus rufiventris]
MSDESISGSDPDLDPDLEQEDMEEEEEEDEEEAMEEDNDGDDEEDLLDESGLGKCKLCSIFPVQTHTLPPTDKVLEQTETAVANERVARREQGQRVRSGKVTLPSSPDECEEAKEKIIWFTF